MNQFRFIFSILFICCFVVASAQIDYRYSLARAGDVIIKQQVEYKDPGRSGGDVIWDFGKLKSINDEYTLDYSEPTLVDKTIYILGKDSIPAKDVSSGDLFVGTEHYTKYFFRIKEGRQYLLGHENPLVQLQYTPPMSILAFPFNYGEKIKGEYKSEGLYSGVINIKTDGTISTQADAYGKMILPTGDTLKHVLRVKNVQTTIEYPNEYSDIHENKLRQLETCRWYSKGYRYPIFETIRSINLKDSTEIFSTAFFFPPQDHFYLDNDKENLAILDSLWNVEHKVIENPTKPGQSMPQQILTYNFYPNPVESYLNIEYYLDQPTPIILSLYNLDGRLVQTINKPMMARGMYVDQLNCSNLTKGTYVLKISTNYANSNDKLIKR